MEIISYKFFILILTTFIFYYTVPKKFQWICLLAASLVFYFFSGTFNFVFILISSLSTFFAAKKLGTYNIFYKERKASNELDKQGLKELKNKLRSKKRLILFLTLILNFGILACLKYWNTIIASINNSTSVDISFLLLNHGKGLLLPLGISFYTFQAVAYLLDVYNEKFSDEKNFFRYLLFISFFPQLIQGPINRYDKMGKDLAVPHDFDFNNIKEGALQFLFGLMKKYVVADTLVKFVDEIFDSPYNNLPGSVIVLGILMYSAYQYADFSGGIDMVLGIAKLFGIRMQPNFRQPYFSISLGDFWRRWHISLGLWMKDYVFYPLALTKGMQKLGKSCSKISKHCGRAIPAGIANIIVFLIVGIWHGPELHYVLWGLYNGLVIAFSDLFKPLFTKVTTILKINTKSLGHKIFQIIRTFIIVNIGWYFDRITDVKKSFYFLGNTFTSFGGQYLKPFVKTLIKSIPFAKSKLGLAITGSCIIFIISLIQSKHDDIFAWYKSRNIAIRWGIMYLFIILFLISRSYSSGTEAFMYANF